MAEGARPLPLPVRSKAPPVLPLRSAPVTVALGTICVLVFVVAQTLGDTLQSTTLVRFGAAEATIVWMGDYWRLATSMFLHIGWVHLVWNIYASWGWCAPVERALGPWRFLATYLVAGIGGSCLSVLGHDVVSAGASGAAFGIIGARLVLERRACGDWRTFFANRGVRGILGGAGIWLVIGMTAVSMDNLAHAGGLATGVAVAALLTSRLQAPRAAFVVGVATLVLFVAGARPWHVTPTPTELRFLAWYGHVYAKGEGLPKDVDRAARFLRRACQGGDAQACAAAQSMAAPR